MSRKKKEFPVIENVEITGIAAEGKAVAHIDEKVVFVPFVVPGDVVDLKIRKKKHKYCEAEVVQFRKMSEKRTKPACKHFGICGGCKWQMLPYEEQLKAKQQQVIDQLTRIGHLQLPECSPILGSEQIWHYRNKLEFGCSNKRWLTKEEIANPNNVFEPSMRNAIGFHITGAFDKIFPIEECWLMDDTCNRIRNAIRDYAIEHDFTFFDLKEKKGLLRDIMFRNAKNTGEWMVLIQFKFESADDKEKALNLLQYLSDNFLEITSLLYVDNQKLNDTFSDLPIHLFKGKDYIIETMEELTFKVGAKSFYQTNTQQAYRLYSVVRELANLSGEELVYDLYTGTGTIANFVAKKSKKVVGIEYVPEAIEDAKENSLRNHINNTLFYAGDMKDILNDDFIEKHGKPDVIITDPPRAGMHPDVVQTILKAAPKRIVYVSCNPATQARDLAVLTSEYTIETVQPVDMFPHTPHVENVVSLSRNDIF